MTEQTISDAIWSGNYWGPNGAIARARREYKSFMRATSEESPELQERKLVYLNALYSAFGSIYPKMRRINGFALVRGLYLLCHIKPLLRQYAELSTASTKLRELTPDRKEMLGAMLMKLSGFRCFGGWGYRIAAVKYAEVALEGVRHDKTSHTAALALLTLARDCMGVESEWGRLLEQLRDAERRSVRVTDPNQRARILRSLAVFWNELGESEKACSLIEHAETVPGISSDVVAKIAEVKKTIVS